MGKTKNEKRMDAKLWDVYRKEGVKTFLDVCSSILSLKDKENWEKKKKVNGELCEVVLAVLTDNYLTKKGITGRVFQSVILLDKDQGRSSDFRTELDFLLLTPSLALTGECKSFVGDITVTNECTLTRGSLVADVYKQSMLHARYLQKYLRAYATIADPPFGMFCFLFSNGRVRDARVLKYKEALPVLTAATLYPYYDRILSRFTGGVYDYERACKTFQRSQNSEALHRQHRDFVGY